MKILLDLDGTLTDPFDGISRCIIHALENMGLPAPSTVELRGWVGPPLRRSFATYLERVGGGEAERALALYRQRFGRQGWRENTVYEGIPEVLSTLRMAGHQLLLATAKPRVYAQRIVAHFHLAPHLSAVHGSELDGRHSDKAELIAHILEHEGLAAKQCVMVGDRGDDMRAARDHGIPGVGVLWGFGTADELLAAGAACLAGHPAELAEQLRRLHGFG